MKKKKLIIDRTFNAPIDKVWAAFTNPEILAKWWSPAGMKNYHASTDVREGGEFRYCFESSEGVRYWGKNAGSACPLWNSGRCTGSDFGRVCIYRERRQNRHENYRREPVR
jgi:hypothetical protein